MDDALTRDMTYRQAGRILAGVDEQTKTLMLAHLLAFGVVAADLGNELLGFYKGVDEEFVNEMINVEC